MNLSRKLIAILVIAAAMLNARAQTASTPAVDGVTVAGVVLDSARKPVPNALVWLELDADPAKASAKTDALGTFVFPGLKPGKYVVSAEKSGSQSEIETVSASSDRTQESVKLTLETASSSDRSRTSSATAMEFSDKPDFTVAGVTDWTAVGGHGSDTVLRTSEELARDAATLKPDGGSAPIQGSGDQQRVAAELAEQSGDPLKAVHEFEEAARLDPSERNYFEWGSELLVHRAVWQATEVFEDGLKVYPNSARMLAALGAALFAGAHYNEAALRVCAASDLSPDDPDPYVFLGKIAIAAPTPLPCVEQRLARFVQKQPESSLANYFYAMALIKAHEPSPDEQVLRQVVSLLNKAVALDPKCGDGWLQLGILAFSHHETQSAIGFYQKAIAANPEAGEARYRLGVAYDRSGKPAEAKEQFQLHDELEKQAAENVERERREIKQFLVVLQTQPKAPPR